MLDKLLELRLLNRNNQNIKKLYLNNINKKDKLIINQEQLNMDILNKNRNTNPYAINYLYSRINSH